MPNSDVEHIKTTSTAILKYGNSPISVLAFHNDQGTV